MNSSLAYETEIVEIRTGNDIAGELGPLKYLSGLTGVPMDKIINILLLTIIFVFDPLAIALVVAANYAFERLRPKTKETIYGEKEIVEDNGMWTEDEIKDFNNQFNADDLLPDEEEEDWEVVDEEDNPIPSPAPPKKPETPKQPEVDTTRLRRTKPNDDLTIRY